VGEQPFEAFEQCIGYSDSQDQVSGGRNSLDQKIFLIGGLTVQTITDEKIYKQGKAFP
jgi:hypothetical protein